MLQYFETFKLGYRKADRRSTAKQKSRKIGRWATSIPDFGGNQAKREVFFTRKVVLLKSARHKDEFAPLPRNGVTEVAFAGRSNVGKSSLLKALCIRNPEVHIADRPGTTTTIDFFQMRSKDIKTGQIIGTLRLVDLPGYGFAYASSSETERWHRLNHEYLREREGLKRVLILIDGRQGLKPTDFALMDSLTSYEVHFQVVVTKCDLVPVVELAQRSTLLKRQLSGYKYAVRSLLMVSSINKAGIPEVWKELTGLMRPEVEQVSAAQGEKAQVSQEAATRGNQTLRLKRRAKRR